MSRVDEDREIQRREELWALERREAERKEQARKASESAFAQLVKEGKNQQQAATAARTSMQDVLRKVKEDQELSGRAHQDQEEALPDNGRSARSGQLRAAAEAKGQSERKNKDGEGLRDLQRSSDGQKAQSEILSEKGQKAQAQGQGEGQRQSSGREADGRRTREVLEERGAHHLQKKPAGGAGAAERGREEAKADPDGQRQGGDGKQGGGDQRGQSGFGSFRFNPALMAPVPIAQKRDMAGSERLRRAASEIAQKIVESARVWTNSKGAAEFQIDLRSNVLSGLSIKVSARGSRIEMVFSGRDKALLSEIEDGAKSLEEALRGRGLTLEHLKFEATA